jgi:hypothetical protein
LSQPLNVNASITLLSSYATAIPAALMIGGHGPFSTGEIGPTPRVLVPAGRDGERQLELSNQAAGPTTAPGGR